MKDIQDARGAIQRRRHQALALTLIGAALLLMLAACAPGDCAGRTGGSAHSRAGDTSCQPLPLRQPPRLPPRQADDKPLQKPKADRRPEATEKPPQSYRSAQTD